MKSILISIKPKWVAKILNGEKTIVIRKTMPKCDLPIDVYIYCIKEKNKLIHYSDGIGYIETKLFNGLEHQPSTPLFLNGKVVAKFTLNKVEEIPNYGLARRSEIMMEELLEKSCLTMGELNKYAPHKEYEDDYIYAWHISNLEIFDKPKELSEFKIKGNCKNCKSYCPATFWNKKRNCLKVLTKAPQNFCYVEVEE